MLLLDYMMLSLSLSIFLLRLPTTPLTNSRIKIAFLEDVLVRVYVLSILLWSLMIIPYENFLLFLPFFTAD